MVHDFAKTVEQSKKRKKRKAPEQSRGRSWLWLFAGMLVGTGLIALFILFKPGLINPRQQNHHNINESAAKSADENRQKNQQHKTQSVAKSQAKVEKIDETQNEDGLRFEFYKRLRDHSIEVEVDDEFSLVTEQNKKVYDYYLQAASLRHYDDAIRLQTKIADIGFKSEILSVELPNGIRWHRLQLGPFPSRLKRDQAANVLVSHEIIPMEIDRPKETNSEAEAINISQQN